MNKIDWKRKLTSRKFWLALAGFVAGIILACNGTPETAETVTGIIMSAASVVVYIFGESWADSQGYAVGEVDKGDEQRQAGADDDDDDDPIFSA